MTITKVTRANESSSLEALVKFATDPAKVKDELEKIQSEQSKLNELTDKLILKTRAKDLEKFIAKELKNLADIQKDIESARSDKEELVRQTKQEVQKIYNLAEHVKDEAAKHAHDVAKRENYLEKKIKEQAKLEEFLISETDRANKKEAEFKAKLADLKERFKGLSV